MIRCLSQRDTTQVVTLTLNLVVCRYLFLTNKSPYSHCKKETNSVCVDKSNCRFIYLYVFYGAIFHKLVSQPMNPEKSDDDCSRTGFMGALADFPSVS